MLLLKIQVCHCEPIGLASLFCACHQQLPFAFALGLGRQAESNPTWGHIRKIKVYLLYTNRNHALSTKPSTCARRFEEWGDRRQARDRLVSQQNNLGTAPFTFTYRAVLLLRIQWDKEWVHQSELSLHSKMFPLQHF